MTWTCQTSRWFATTLVAASAFVTGCGGMPRTTVVLLPDSDGHVGAVVVSDSAGRQRLDQAFNAVTVADATTRPSPMTLRGEPAVVQSYGDLIKAEPSPPASFTLYFVLDSVTLTEESRAVLPEMIATARRRKPTEITVYGHADASGTERRNEALSEERARVVAGLLRKADPRLDRIDCQWFGDRVPLVPGDGHSPQQRNRRAEVVIL